MKPNQDISGQQIVLNHGGNIFNVYIKKLVNIDTKLSLISEDYSQGQFFWRIRLPGFIWIYCSYRKRTVAKVTKTPEEIHFAQDYEF